MRHAEAVTVMDSGGLEQLEGFPTEGSWKFELNHAP